MPRVCLKWVRRCCLSIVTLGHAYQMPRLSVHHLLGNSRRKLPMEKNSFLPNKYKKTEQHFYNKGKIDQYTRRLRYTWRTLLKLKNTKVWSTKYQRINKQPIKTKTTKYTRRVRCITSAWTTLIKLANTKKLNMTEHKTDMNSSKIDKDKKD